MSYSNVDNRRSVLASAIKIKKKSQSTTNDGVPT